MQEVVEAAWGNSVGMFGLGVGGWRVDGRWVYEGGGGGIKMGESMRR